MSQADEAISTSPGPAIDRRAFLLVGGTAFINGELLPNGISPPLPSPHYQAYLDARVALDEAYSTPDVQNETPLGVALQEIVDSSLGKAISAIKARRPNCLEDVIELARVTLAEGSEDWEFLRCTYQFEEALTRAVLALADGGANA